MKGIVITTQDKMFVKDFGEPLYKTVGEAVGGYIEIVHPRRLMHPYVIIVNEEGLLKCLDLNMVGCIWYRTDKHDVPIVGDIVVMKEGVNDDGEPDIVGLDDQEIEALKKLAMKTYSGLEEVEV